MKEIWAKVVQHHQNKAQLIIVELHTQLQNEKCPDQGDICEHLAKRCQMREDLALMGKSVTDENFCTIILSSLPLSYNNYLTSITNQLSPTSIMITIPERTVGTLVIPAFETLITPPKIDPDRLIESLGQEADRRALREKGTKKEKEDVALTTSPDSAGTKKKERPKVKCFNCKKQGHYQKDCWAKGGGKEGQGPKQKRKGADKAAAVDDDDSATAWAAIVRGDNQGKMAGIDHAHLAETDEHADIELYDSSTSHHMSLYCAKFLNYTEILTKNIYAADRRTFKALGKGDIQISVPNGSETTKVLLRDVLYAPAMSATLVSVAKITEAKHSVMFKGAECLIHGPNGKLVGQIPCKNGLYQVNHSVCNVDG